MYATVETGLRIKKLRKTHKYTQAELSEIVGCSESNLQKIENGKQGASLDMLYELSNVFGTSIDYLVKGDNKRESLHSDFVNILFGRNEKEVNLAYRLLIMLFK